MNNEIKVGDLVKRIVVDYKDNVPIGTIGIVVWIGSEHKRSAYSVFVQNELCFWFVGYLTKFK